MSKTRNPETKAKHHLKKVWKHYEEVREGLNPTTAEFVDSLMAEELAYASVLAQLRQNADDPLVEQELRNIFEFHLTKHLVMAIYENIDDGQAEHLSQYMDQDMVIRPGKPLDDVIIEFALLYDELMETVYDTVPAFVEKFIADFNS